MAFSHDEMHRRHFVAGDPTKGESIGALDPKRLNHHAQLLHELGVLRRPLALEDYATTEYLR